MKNETLSGDLLIGVPAIAQYLGVSERRVYHWTQKSLIPSFKIGVLTAARRSELDEAMSKKGAA